MSDLQNPSLFSNIVKSGKVSVSVNNDIFFQIKVNHPLIDFNILEKRIIKEFFRNNEKHLSFRNVIELTKKLAKELGSQGVTLSISYQDNKIVTLGSKANPKFSKFVTRSSYIQIDNPIMLLQLTEF
jgi:hypothetical protein